MSDYSFMKSGFDNVQDAVNEEEMKVSEETVSLLERIVVHSRTIRDVTSWMQLPHPVNLYANFELFRQFSLPEIKPSSKFPDPLISLSWTRFSSYFSRNLLTI